MRSPPRVRLVSVPATTNPLFAALQKQATACNASSPIPAVGGLQHHLRALTSPGHHRRQPLDVINDPHRLEHLTTLGGPHDHRPATVQIDSYNAAYRNTLPSWVSSPSRVPHDAPNHHAGRCHVGSGGG